MKLLFNRNIIVLVLFTLLFALPVFADTEGEIRDFNIDKSYDSDSRKEISAVLEKVSDQLYFYIDNEWLMSLTSPERSELSKKLNDLTREFKTTIYPTLTSNYGNEPNPGIDGDRHVVIVAHPMRNSSGGYFYSGNTYSKYLVNDSNEREMFYINTDYLDSPIAKSLIAHEFTHLITFNQKNLRYDKEEEIWLNEARAEYAPTLCGYNNEFKDSYLEQRVNIFLKYNFDSIVDWSKDKGDYGALSLFVHYLVDHYGVGILKDSLQSPKIGIDSLNYALRNTGKTFSDIFADWTVAMAVNDCSLGSKYCYKNNSLRDIKVLLTSNFLPLNSESILSVVSSAKPWAGSWQKIFGGGGNLTFEFDGSTGGIFKVYYVLCSKTNKCKVDELVLNSSNYGEFVVDGFNEKYNHLIIIPSVHNEKTLSKFSFSWTTRINLEDKIEEEPSQDNELIQKLLSKIDELKERIAQVQAQINTILASSSSSSYCAGIDSNLSFGIENNSQVSCLQDFLKSQDNVYPEGLVTGNFFNLTKSAVIRFQEKYASEILSPLGLSQGTGYVGSSTRAKINSLMGYRLTRF